MQSDREFFANSIPADGDPAEHVATIRRTPIISGYPGAVRYLREVRGVNFSRARLMRAVADGQLAYYPIAQAYCFTADDLDAYLESLRVAEAAR